jgi:hypothetical protein
MAQTITLATTGQKMSAKEFAERRMIVKAINGMISWARSALTGFDFDAQTEQYGDVWRITITVGWKPLPLPVEIVPTAEINGRLT